MENKKREKQIIPNRIIPNSMNEYISNLVKDVLAKELEFGKISVNYFDSFFPNREKKLLRNFDLFSAVVAKIKKKLSENDVYRENFLDSR